MATNRPEPLDSTQAVYDPCDHPSATGIDTTPSGPEKVWRCDCCGWLYSYVRDAQGVEHMVEV